jgi:hypothetical protein
MKEKVALKKNTNMVSRQIDKETILVPILKESGDINCIYTLNEAACAVWNMIDAKNTIEEIKKVILKKFDVSSRDTEKKLESFLKELKEIKAIKIIKNRK